MSAGMLDTSVVIALARGETVQRPDSAAVSAVTLCELHHGVLFADDVRRPGRLATLALVERSFRPLPLDERVAPHFGRLVTAARRAGARPRTADALIAATAAAHDLTLYTRDRGFEAFADLDVVFS